MSHLCYFQNQGVLSFVPDSGEPRVLTSQAWAGRGPGKNYHEAQDQPGVGPLPCGWYTLGDPIPQHPRVGHYAIPLIPDAGNEMFGRSGFFIHGASMNPAKAGQESHGCIIASFPVRQEAQRLSRRLMVVR